MDPPVEEEDDATATARRGVWSKLAASTAPEPSEKNSYQGQPVVVLVRGDRILRVFRLGGGCVPLGLLKSVRREELKRFRKKHRVPFVVVVRVESIPTLWTELQQVMGSAEDDFLAQGLAALRLLRNAESDSLIFEPRLFGDLPIPTYDAVQRSFNQMLPDDKTLVFYLIDQGRVWTSLIARKRAGDIDLITTHQGIEKTIRWDNYRTAAKEVLQEVGQRFAPPHVGLFLSLQVWSQFIHGDRSAIARAMATRKAIVDPAPAWLLALVGAAAFSDAANRSARLAGKLLSKTPFSGVLLSEGAQRMMQRVANPLEALGLDPWDMIRWANNWSGRSRSIF
jgi:hypothetical protein